MAKYRLLRVEMRRRKCYTSTQHAIDIALSREARRNIKKKTVNIQKPEVTETQIRIPVGSPCEITATITIDAEQGIQALYCGKEKRIRTYIFDKEKWTMATAQAWIKEHKSKANIGKAQLSKKKKAPFFRFSKIDSTQQIVGGVVYAPAEIDSQQDYTDSAEIQKAMYKFMESYAKNASKIKVMHRGRSYEFPILEIFQPEQDITKGNDTIKAGAWWMMIKVKSKAIWRMIESGDLTGFSMGGRAKS